MCSNFLILSLYWRILRVTDFVLASRVRRRTLRVCLFTTERFRRYRDITGSIFIAVVVLRVHRNAGSSYCGFVAVVVLRVRRCRCNAGSSLSLYCGFVAVVVLLVRRNYHITGSSYYGFVAVVAGSSVVLLRVRHRRRNCEFIAVVILLVHRIAGSSMSSSCEFTNYRIAGSSLSSYCGL